MAFTTLGGPVVRTFGGDTSYDVLLPGTVAAGAAIIVVITCGFGTDTANSWNTPPSGWALKRENLNTGGTGATSIGVFVKVATGTEGGTTVTFSRNTLNSSGNSYAYIWYADRGQAYDIDDIQVSTVNTGTDNNPNPPNLTPTFEQGDTTWLAVYGKFSNIGNSAYPTNYDSGQQTNSSGSSVTGMTMAAAYRQLNAASENPGAFTTNSLSRPWNAVVIAIRGTAAVAIDVDLDPIVIEYETQPLTITQGFNIPLTPIVAEFDIVDLSVQIDIVVSLNPIIVEFDLPPLGVEQNIEVELDVIEMEYVLPALGVTRFVPFADISRELDPADWTTELEWVLEVHGETSNGSSPLQVYLYNVTDAEVVSGSEFTISSTTKSRVRSSAFSLATGTKQYKVVFGGPQGETYKLYDAVLIGTPTES